MKKLLALLLSLTLVIAMVTGCGKSDDTNDADPTTAPTAEPTTAPTEAPADTNDGDAVTAGAKTGLAVITSIAKSADAGDADGLAEVDSTVVAVIVGADGKILDCAIDAAQTKVNFSKEGKVLTDLATEYKTKQELGTEYGMLKSSDIGKEWNEQADAFAAYAIGKTVEEIKGITVTDEGVAGDADLAASVTVHVGDFINGVEKAVNNAQVLGAKDGDKIGLGISTSISGSKDASAEGDGLAQAYTYYTAVTTDADGKITSSILDASQGNVNFSAAGAVTSDLTAEVLTKQELKEEYGMKKASDIGKEWYEQANAFAEYATGKTLAEVQGISVSEDGKAVDADLTSSVTVHIVDFIKVIEKAVANAQ